MGIRYDNSADYSRITSGVPSDQNCSLMGWFRIVTDRNAFSTFLAMDDFDLPANGCLCQTDTDGTTLTAYCQGSTGAGSALAVGTWYHMAMTCATKGANSVKVYLNGVLNGQATQTGDIVTPNLYVGNNGGSEFLNGRAAAIKVWNNVVLTASEIATEMWQYAPVRFAGLYGFWPMLSVADDETDYSTNARALTIGGTLATEEGPPIPWRRSRRRQTFWAAAAAGRTTKNTRSHPLGIRSGVNWRVVG